MSKITNLEEYKSRYTPQELEAVVKSYWEKISSVKYTNFDSEGNRKKHRINNNNAVKRRL